MPPAVQIPRVRALAPEDFAREHLQGAGRPVIVTDATEQWAARSKWTFQFLKETYGADLVCPELGLDSGIGKITKLSSYIDFLDDPGGELPGFWTNIADGTPINASHALPDVLPYLVDWHAFQHHPELYDDIAPPFYFIDDWASALGPDLRDAFERALKRVYCDILVGPAGSLSALHFDFGHTHSCLSQLRGAKRALLFSPEDSPFLYDGRVNPEAPDLARFELFDRATAYEAVLEPGDVLYIPPDWWHAVRTLEKSITVGHNFFNGANGLAHLQDVVKHMARQWVRP